jgi:hypothetical protein
MKTGEVIGCDPITLYGCASVIAGTCRCDCNHHAGHLQTIAACNPGTATLVFLTLNFAMELVLVRSSFILALKLTLGRDDMQIFCGSFKVLAATAAASQDRIAFS